MYQTNTYDDPKVLDPSIRSCWEFRETGSAAAILQAVCPREWDDIVAFLASYRLDPKHWLKKGGNRGDIASQVDSFFEQRGWREMRIDLETKGVLITRNNEIVGELDSIRQEGYLVDNVKGRVALDVEWNAKDGNLDRDLSAYRAWHEAGIITAAVIITKDREPLKHLAERLWREYQETLPRDQRSIRLPIDLSTSTVTSLDKAELRVRRGVMGVCPLLLVAANDKTWNGEPYSE